MSYVNYQAWATGGFSAYGQTPKEAAAKFFEAYPNKRKCNIVQGVVDGHFFVIKYGRISKNEWPESYRDISKKMVCDLPG